MRQGHPVPSPVWTRFGRLCACAILALACLAWLLPLPARAAEVPGDHWSVGELRILARHGLCSGPFPERQAYGRRELAAAVAQAAQAGLGIVAMKAVGGHRLFKDGRLNVNARAAIKWVLQDPHVHTVIAGCTTFDQLAEDLPILADLTLTEPEKKDLQAASAVAGLFCQNCGQCLDQCRYGLPIPDLMRAYMYTYGYPNLGAAHDLLTELKVPAQACGDCAACPVKCAVGFDVAAKVRDVVRLAATPREFLV
jgi:predicted aldo/keto reductase-like oxidoreductase